MPPSTPHDANSMDQVRELLFGAQVKEIEERLQKQEAYIMKQLADLRDEMRAAMQSMESTVNIRLQSESKERGEDKSDYQKQLASLKTELENRSAALYSALNKSEGSLHELISNENVRITATVEERYKFALDSLSENTLQIRKDMVDRNTISALLGELAQKIAPDEKTTQAEKSGKKG